jgi:hypothetical protein
VNSKLTTIIIGGLVVISFSAATAVVVHHNDIVSSNHAMMASEAMQKTEIKNAADDAAMKQKEADTVVVPDAMKHDTSPATVPATR